jgi:RNA polymerase sigma-70 factor, ECF subfamily
MDASPATWMRTLEHAEAPASSDPEDEVLRLFTEHGAPLYRFCASMLGAGGEAEDIVQDSYVKLLKHLRRDGDRSNLKSWLFTVAANACRSRLRWRLRWKPWSAEDDRRTVLPETEALDVRRAVAAMRGLPARDRLLISLRAQGLSYREIAAAASIREPSVGRLLARAVDRWRRATTEMR